MLRYLLLLVFIPPFLFGFAGALFTSSKLDRMRQIRGLKPGATVQNAIVHDKRDDNRGGYWISFTEKDIRRPGNHRFNLPVEVWNRFQPGDTIEVVYLLGDPTPYHREGIYADDGNFFLDTAILVVECGFMVFSLLVGGFIFWWLGRIQRPPPASTAS